MYNEYESRVSCYKFYYLCYNIGTDKGYTVHGNDQLFKTAEDCADSIRQHGGAAKYGEFVMVQVA
jgi:hypothetical protein